MHLSLRQRLVVAGLALAALAGGVYRWYHPDLSQLTADQIERLRLKAQAAPQTDALATIELSADQGNRFAQRSAAFLLFLQRDPVSWQTGLHYARQAAQQGDREAFLLLGEAYFNGHATLNQVPDYGLARHWFELAAERGSDRAQYWLGLIYKSGYGIAADPARAITWFQQAVDHGNADAMFMLGNAYSYGDGVQRDKKRARTLYQAAAVREHPLATQTLAIAVQQGDLGYSQNQQQAEEMLHETEHQLDHQKAGSP